ncbi:MAG: hypothetical protein VX733_11330 [Candidatus Latescibacterota bacterium]|nr:hypothetical protein [Candidatus Latescibacterota bacterium]
MQGQTNSLEMIEKGVTRRHTFFCVDRERHVTNANVIEVEEKTIEVFDHTIHGWIITTEEQVIDKTISLDESLEGLILHDPE